MGDPLDRSRLTPASLMVEIFIGGFGTRCVRVMVDKCPKCGSGNIIGYMGEWECMDCGYKFKPPSPATQYMKPSHGRGRWIGVIALVFIVGSLLGYFSGYILIPYAGQIITVTKSIERESPTSMGKMLVITITNTVTSIVEKTATQSIGGVSPMVVEKTFTVTVTSTMTSILERTTTKEVVREETVTIVPTQNITEQHIVMRVGETVGLEGYDFSVTSIKSPEYIKLGENYYKPHEGMKILVVRLSALNIGEEEIRCPIGGLVLITDKGLTYEEAFPWYLEFIPSENVSGEVIEHAIDYEVFPYLRLVPPNTYCEGDILFEYPIDENPESIIFKPNPYTTVEILLSST
jgi:hypothetical protein